MEWSLPRVRSFLTGHLKCGVFLPFASVRLSWERYTDRVRDALEISELTSLHETADPAALVQEASALIVGGGNTFCLLRELENRDVLAPLQERIRQGCPYLGWSAGANLACPTIQTTNDMPIQQPRSFRALNLVPYQINPHFTPDRLPHHGGESRLDRIQEFLTLHPEAVVVGLPEGTGLEVSADRHVIFGRQAVHYFSTTGTREIPPGDCIPVSTTSMMKP